MILKLNYYSLHSDSTAKKRVIVLNNMHHRPCQWHHHTHSKHRAVCLETPHKCWRTHRLRMTWHLLFWRAELNKCLSGSEFSFYKNVQIIPLSIIRRPPHTHTRLQQQERPCTILRMREKMLRYSLDPAHRWRRGCSSASESRYAPHSFRSLKTPRDNSHPKQS